MRMEENLGFVHKNENQSCKSSIGRFLWINEFLSTRAPQSSKSLLPNEPFKEIYYDIIKKKKKCFFIITVLCLITISNRSLFVNYA